MVHGDRDKAVRILTPVYKFGTRPKCLWAFAARREKEF
jgi:hypothetical protein